MRIEIRVGHARKQDNPAPNSMPQISNQLTHLQHVYRLICL